MRLAGELFPGSLIALAQLERALAARDLAPSDEPYWQDGGTGSDFE